MYVAFPDIAAADALVTPKAVPVGKTSAVELLGGYAAEVELAEVEAETLKAVNEEVPFRADVVINGTVETVPFDTGTEVILATEGGVKVPTIEKIDVIVVTDVIRVVPTLPASEGAVPLKGVRVPKVGVEVARVVVFLMLEGDPVTVVACEAFAVRLPTGSDMLVVYGIEVPRKGAVLVAVLAADALVENEFTRVIFMEGAVVRFRASEVVGNIPSGVVVLGRTTSVEVEVIVLMASVVMTEIEVLILFLLDDGVWRRLDDSRLLVSE